MGDGQLRNGAQTPKSGYPNLEFDVPSKYVRPLRRQDGLGMGLKQALADMDVQLGKRDELLRHMENLGRESDHRLMNSLQMIVSLLSLQSRTTPNMEAAAELKVAANRVAMIVRIHRRLHSYDKVEVVAFKRYIEDLCRDFATMLAPPGRPEQVIVVEGAELMLPADIGIPMGFVVSELITNAAKHGKGRISVRLEEISGKGRALSVCNDGSALPEGFDPAASKGLGMKIICSFVAKVGGELKFGPNEGNTGTRFTVLFA